MKRLFSFVAIALLVMGLAIPAYAGTVTPTYSVNTGMGEVKTVSLLNESSTHADTFIPITSIIPGKCKIVGYSSCTTGTLSSNTENIVSVADLGSTGDTASVIFSENESHSQAGLDYLFPLGGIRIHSGLHVGQGSRTMVTIYYVQDRP